jgi:hypothetical protein
MFERPPPSCPGTPAAKRGKLLSGSFRRGRRRGKRGWKDGVRDTRPAPTREDAEPDDLRLGWALAFGEEAIRGGRAGPGCLEDEARGILGILGDREGVDGVAGQCQ